MNLKNSIFGLVAASFFATTSLASAETLYVLNGGSANGSNFSIQTALVQDLEDRFDDVVYMHTDGCLKTSVMVDRATKNGDSVIWRFVNAYIGEQYCDKIFTGIDSVLNAEFKTGFIVSLKDVGVPLLQDGTTVGHTEATSNDVDAIISANNVDLKKVVYASSKDLTNAVLNGEVAYGYLNSAKRYYHNEDVMTAHYNFTGGEFDGTPSVTTIGGIEYATDELTAYKGNLSIDEMREIFLEEVNKDDSAWGAYMKADRSRGSTAFMENPIESAKVILDRNDWN